MASENTFFTHEGHLSEAALTAVADGQEHLLPIDIVTHLDGCEHCAVRLGDAALLSAQVAAAIEGLPQAAAETVPRYALPPRWAMAIVALCAASTLAIRSVSLLRGDPLESASMLFDAANDYASLPAASTVITALQYAAPLAFLCAAIAAGMFASRSLVRSAS